MLLQIFLLIDPRWTNFFSTGRPPTRRGAQILLSENTLSILNDFGLVFVGRKQVLIGFIKLLLSCADWSTLGCSWHGHSSQGIVGIRSVIEAILDLLQKFCIVLSRQVILVGEICKVGLKLVRVHKLRRLCRSFLTFTITWVMVRWVCRRSTWLIFKLHLYALMELGLIIRLALELRRQIIICSSLDVDWFTDDLVLLSGNSLFLLLEKALGLVNLSLVLLNELISCLLRCIGMGDQTDSFSLWFPALMLLMLLANHSNVGRLLLGLGFGWCTTSHAII